MSDEHTPLSGSEQDLGELAMMSQDAQREFPCGTPTSTPWDVAHGVFSTGTRPRRPVTCSRAVRRATPLNLTRKRPDNPRLYVEPDGGELRNLTAARTFSNPIRFRTRRSALPRRRHRFAWVSSGH